MTTPDVSKQAPRQARPLPTMPGAERFYTFAAVLFYILVGVFAAAIMQGILEELFKRKFGPAVSWALIGVVCIYGVNAVRLTRSGMSPGKALAWAPLTTLGQGLLVALIWWLGATFWTAGLTNKLLMLILAAILAGAGAITWAIRRRS